MRSIINITYLVQEPGDSQGSMVRPGGRCVREQVVILFYFGAQIIIRHWLWSGLAES